MAIVFKKRPKILIHKSNLVISLMLSNNIKKLKSQWGPSICKLGLAWQPVQKCFFETLNLGNLMKGREGSLNQLRNVKTNL